MNSVQVSALDFQAGSLPDVCARTGQLAKNRYRVVARTADGKPLNGAVVLHGSVARRINALRVVSAVALAATLACMAVGFAAGLYVLAIPALAGVVVSFLATRAAANAGIKATVVPGTDLVELSPVADGFKLAILVPGGGGCGNDCNCGKGHEEACADDAASSAKSAR